MLNLNAARRRPLFESARALIGDEEPRGPALIVAQAAVEVAFETMIDFALQMRQVYESSVGTRLASAGVLGWLPSCGVCEPGVEEVGGLLFVAGEEVAVAVEGDGDGGVAHVGAEGFGVDAGGDHVGGVGVAAFVEADRL